MTGYERVTEAIRTLEEHHAEQPDLTTLAAEVGLSPSRFHREFSAWAAATPKDLLQCLALSNAKELLRRGENALQTSLDSGLSEPSRRHGLCVSLEAATPGEIKTRGADLTIRAGVADSPFGNCLIGETSRGICHLSFFDGNDRENNVAGMHADWPLATLAWDDKNAVKVARNIFSPASDRSSTWKLFVCGTPFQLRVWRALLKIPPGALVSYGKLAAAAGNPNASRATGTAVGSNAISFLIPCHRVIRETGISGHYRWGALRKRAILAWECGRGNTMNLSGRD